jgi:hypothetical protein
LFIIAPSLARLIQKERGGERVIEGYFPDQPGRSTYVQIEETRSSLILTYRSERSAEERVDIPPAHAQALLAATAGQVEYVQTDLSVGTTRIVLQHVIRPSALDLVVVEPEDGRDFHPLPWLGPDMSGDPAYQAQRMALGISPDLPEVELTNEALNSLLDVLETSFTSCPSPHDAAAPEEMAPDQSAAPRPAKPASPPMMTRMPMTSELRTMSSGNWPVRCALIPAHEALTPLSEQAPGLPCARRQKPVLWLLAGERLVAVLRGGTMLL